MQEGINHNEKLILNKNEYDDDIDKFGLKPKKTKIFIDYLIKPREDDDTIFTKEEIRDHALTLLSAVSCLKLILDFLLNRS